MKLKLPKHKKMMDFESCRFDFRIDSKNGLTPSKRKKAERKGVNHFTLFKCKVCGNLFESRPSLLEHKMTHNKFKCVFCEARFARQTWMMDHVALVHGMGEVSADAAKRTRKSSTSAPRKLLPKPVEDVDLGGATVISESDSEPPSPMTSPSQQLDCPSPVVPFASGVSTTGPPLLDVPLPAQFPDLLPMGLSLSLPLTPQPISTQPSTPAPQLQLPQQAVSTPQLLTNPPQLLTSPSQLLTSPSQLLTSLPQLLTSPPQLLTSPPQLLTSPPQLLTSPPQLLPAFPQGSPVSLPQLVSTNSTAPSCIYINVPILLPPGPGSSSDTSVTGSQSLATIPQLPTVTETIARRESPTPQPTPNRMPSLLPVNPFVRKDLPPVNIADVPHLFPQPLQTFDNNQAKGIAPQTANTESPMPPLLRPLSNLPVTPTPLVTGQQQEEALDFSTKTEVKVSPIKPPRRQDVVVDEIIDLSVRSTSSTPESRTSKAEDDRAVMLQEYKETRSTVENRPQAPVISHRTLTKSTAQRVAPKRHRTVLDKMVQKLWKSKIARTDDELNVAQAEPAQEPSSLGRVYVLNQVPAQTPSLMSPRASTSATVAGHQTSDSVLQSTAANITKNIFAENKNNESGTKDFCSIKFHTCRVCKQLFNSAEEMWEHAVTHQDFHKYKCNQCSYATACYRELASHKQTTHGHDMQKDGRHICTYPGCMRSYSEWRYLRDHQKTHQKVEEKPSTYTSPPASNNSPTKGGRLVCDFPGCFKTFKEWRHLKVHQTLHTGEKPLACQLCNYACRHRSSMNWHMKSKHGLDKMKTQGNRTVYVDANKRVVCGWSDEANREVNYLRETGSRLPPHLENMEALDIKPRLEDLNSMSEYSSNIDESRPASTDVSQFDTSQPDMKMPLPLMDTCSSVSMTSSRPPSCAPSENPSERSLMDDPHLLMLKMQAKPGEFPLNMSVQIEDLSPTEKMVGEDGRITSKMSDASDKLSDKLMIDTSQDCGLSSSGDVHSPAYTQSTVSSSVSSCETASLATSETNRLVMTPVAVSNLGQGADHQASMMKFKLKYLVAPKYFPCKICNENFESASAMFQHRIESHKSETRFYCDGCPYHTEDMSQLQSHMLSTHGKEMGGHKTFICFICGKGYATKTGLNQHLLRHSEEGPPQYECPYEQCASKVHSKCALKNHIRRVHLKVPAKHVCPEEGCERRFDSSSALKNHQVLHSDDRPLSCDFPNCDKSFRESKHLKVHRMQHTDEKPIKCDACEYSCRQRNSMNWHMKSKHNREKTVSADGRTIYVLCDP